MMDARLSAMFTALASMAKPDLSNKQLNRYSRHILLPEIDLEGQARILAANIAIIGAGGLGTPAAMYLSASGVGNITLIDHDAVDLGNLQRQIAYAFDDINQAKVEALKQHLSARNAETNITAIQERASSTRLLNLAKQNNIIIDATDNFETRFNINRACVETRTPLISGAAMQFKGQALTIMPGQACYNCMYEEIAEEEQQNCSNLGVLSPLTGIIGSILATEALKVITQTGSLLQNRLLNVDSLSMEFRTSRIQRDPNCPTCGKSSKNNA